MAPPTPQNLGVTSLLQGINNGLSFLARNRGPRLDEDSSSDDDVLVASNLGENTNFGDNAQTSTVAALPSPPNNQVNKENEAVVSPTSTMAKPRKKKARTNKKKSPSKNEGPVLNHPSVDPPRRQVTNPSSMQEAFDAGYDSDGWEGPPKGTDPGELEDVEEEPVTATKPPAVTDEATEQPVHVPIDDETLQKLTVKLLKHELKIRRVPTPKGSVKKDVLQQKLREALEKCYPVYPESHWKLSAKDDMSMFAVGAWWDELKPDVNVDEPINNNFPTARAPTVPLADANMQPKPKQSFSATFDRPVFTGRDSNGGIRTRGGPKASFLDRHHLTKDSTPIDFAEAFFPMYNNTVVDHNNDPFVSMECLARNTNMRANLAFAGEALHNDNTWAGPFSVKEIRQHLGLLVLNGLSPSPSMEMKFDKSDVANYNPYVAANFGTNPVRRLRQFRGFFTCQDPMKPAPPRTRSPLFKVLPMITWIRKLGPICWECGINIGVDEQTMGFQGHHVDKLRTSYKKEGDGFQCDALCDEGFTYSVYFRNEPPPPECIRQGLSPLHARCMWLFDQLQDQCHRAWVDNLYMSARMAKAAYNTPNKVMTAGVCRTKDRGVPVSVLQDVVKKQQLPTTRGTMKASVLHGDANCPSLVVASIYDNKPVHFISLIAESIKWIEKKRKVWNNSTNKLQDVNFLRVNVNDDYNHLMNPVDIADQLRNNYRFDHWMRQKKWWWSIFLWSFGVLLTNSHLVCTRVMEEARINKRLTHYEFLLAIAKDWIDTEEEDIKVLQRRRARERRRQAAAATRSETAREETPASSTATSSSSSTETAWTKTPEKATRVNDHTLDPLKGSLRHRLYGYNFHCPQKPTIVKPICALHRWALGRSGGCKRGQKIVCCSECKIHLCIDCFHAFHTVRELPKMKTNLKEKFEKAKSKQSADISKQRAGSYPIVDI